ncbi:MAG: VWA domain-containing protein [Chloroflexota bacterium]|nr:VWA domain-containing protein [Chloroflexota bacterium]
MALDRPWLLILLAALPAAVWLSYASVARLSRIRRGLATLLRLVGLTAIVLALAGFAIGRDTRPATIFVVDTSDSVLLAERANAHAVMDAYVSAFGADTPVGVVQFGAGAAVLAAPQRLDAAPPLRSDLPDHDSNYEAGILAALGLLDPEAGGQLVLLSDGAGAGPGLESATQTAAARGVPISVVPAAASRGADLVVRAVEVPETVHSGRALQAQVRIASQRRTTARLRLWDGERLISDGPVVVATGTRTYGVELTGLGPGFHRLRTELLEDADPRLANNVAETFVRVAEPGRVLTIGETSQVRAALRAAEFEVRDVAPGALAGIDLAEFDAVVVSNVPADAFEPDALEALRAHVAGGRGLVVLGGPDSFAAGGYQGTAMDDALPVWSDPTEETPEPRLALVLVIDRSSSMAEGASDGAAKVDMAIEAAVDAVDLLEEGDILGVMTFDIDSQWVVPPRELSSAADVASAIDRIRGIQIGTSTDLARAMFFARSRLDQVSASIKHVVLLTDGRAHYGDFDGLTRSLRRRDITVSSIAVGEQSDQELLERIARIGNGRYYYVPDPLSIPRVLTQETLTAGEFAVVEREFQPRMDAPSPVFTGGISGQEFPDLRGYVRTRAKPTAEVVLSSDNNDPILAQWQYGRGRAIAWTSDAGADWAEVWLAWDGFAHFLRQAVQWVSPLPGGVGDSLQASAAQVDGIGVIEVDAIDAAGRFRNGLATTLTVVGPDGTRRTLQAEQVGPGRYQGRLEGLSPGVYEIQVTQRDDSGLVGEANSGLVVAPAEEVGHIAPDPRALRRVADLTGGVTIASSGDLASLALGREAGGQLGWAQLLTIALLAFVADVGVRRLTGRPGEIRDRLGQRVRSLRAAPGALRRLYWPDSRTA